MAKLNRRKVIGVLSASAALLSMAFLLNPYLAHTEARGRGVLIVEGWIPEATLAFAPDTFERGAYSHALIVADSEETRHLDPIISRLKRACLRKGLPPANIVIAARLPDGTNPRDFDKASGKGLEPPMIFRDQANRTYYTAVAAKERLTRLQVEADEADVYTVGVHARKSWIFFQYVLSPQYKVGVVSGPELSYDPRIWFGSARGRYLVLRNLAGYIYAKVWVSVK